MKYAGAFLIKPNLSELQDMAGMMVKTDEQIVAASSKLKEICRSQCILTTCGGRGMILIGEKKPIIVNADDHEVFDVTGAGDTALAYLAAVLANEFSVKKAVEISNHAAGLQVTKTGTAVIGLSEVRESAYRLEEDVAGKVLSRRFAEDLRKCASDKKIVFTNGCFDILHVGHIRYLRQAAELGDILVVGLNSDASVKRLKGENRPINSEYDRAELLASLEFVNYIVIFEEDTPYELIKQIKPDVLVKGSDYAPEDVVGKDIVESYGGKLMLIDFVNGKSTTGIIHRIRNEEYSE